MNQRTAPAPSEGHAAAARLRAGLLALAAAGILGTAVELWTIHHWETAVQLIPWAALAVLATGVALVALAPRPGTVRYALAVAAVSFASGAYGVVDHVSSNLSSGPLDGTYGPKWDGMSTLSRWWAAASGQVGPAPVLAPAVLAQIGACLLLAALWHPARRRSGADPAGPPAL